MQIANMKSSELYIRIHPFWISYEKKEGIHRIQWRFRRLWRLSYIHDVQEGDERVYVADIMSWDWEQECTTLGGGNYSVFGSERDMKDFHLATDLHIQRFLERNMDIDRVYLEEHLQFKQEDVGFPDKLVDRILRIHEELHK